VPGGGRYGQRASRFRSWKDLQRAGNFQDVVLQIFGSANLTGDRKKEDFLPFGKEEGVSRRGRAERRGGGNRRDGGTTGLDDHRRIPKEAVGYEECV